MIKIPDKDKLHNFRKWASAAPVVITIPIFWQNPSEQLALFMCLLSVWFYMCVYAPQKAIDYAKLGAKISKPQEAGLALFSMIATYATIALGFMIFPFASAIFIAPGMGAVYGTLSVVLALGAIKIWEWA